MYLVTRVMSAKEKVEKGAVSSEEEGQIVDDEEDVGKLEQESFEK